MVDIQAHYKFKAFLPVILLLSTKTNMPIKSINYSNWVQNKLNMYVDKTGIPAKFIQRTPIEYIQYPESLCSPR